MPGKRKLTLLAPARDLEVGIAAIQAGADQLKAPALWIKTRRH